MRRGGLPRVATSIPRQRIDRVAIARLTRRRSRRERIARGSVSGRRSSVSGSTRRGRRTGYANGELDGQATRSCTLLAVQAAGREVTTVEGLAREGKPHALQRAFMECHGLQCGFCTPGMLMSAAALLRENRNPSEAEIVDALEGNLCRCTGYVNIVASVQQAAKLLRAEAST